MSKRAARNLVLEAQRRFPIAAGIRHRNQVGQVEEVRAVATNAAEPVTQSSTRCEAAVEAAVEAPQYIYGLV